MDKLRPASSAENTTVWTRCGFYSLKGQIELETGMSCRCRHAKIKYFRNTTQRRFPLGVGGKSLLLFLLNRELSSMWRSFPIIQKGQSELPGNYHLHSYAVVENSVLHIVAQKYLIVLYTLKLKQQAIIYRIEMHCDLFYNYIIALWTEIALNPSGPKFPALANNIHENTLHC